MTRRIDPSSVGPVTEICQAVRDERGRLVSVLKFGSGSPPQDELVAARAIIKQNGELLRRAADYIETTERARRVAQAEIAALKQRIATLEQRERERAKRDSPAAIEQRRIDEQRAQRLRQFRPGG